MGFLDRAKATATQAMQQGQAKVNAYQQNRSEAELYRALGEATYKARRQGGDQAAVDAALVALDEHYAQVAPSAESATSAPGGTSPSAGASAPSAGTGTSSPAPPPSGNFTLDDM